MYQAKEQLPAQKTSAPRRPAILRVLRKIAGRLGGALLVIWAVVTVTFIAVRAVPGDPLQAVLGGPGSNASEEAVAAAIEQYGFNLPLWQQYLRYLAQVASGNLGDSYSLRAPVTQIIGEQLPATLTLALAGFFAGWLLALVLAWWSVVGGRGAWAIASGFEAVASILPQFWIATVLIAIFAVGFGLPVAVSQPGPAGLVLPAITLAIPAAGFLGQTMRERMLDTLEQPFVIAARARGISTSQLFFKHILRHAALPAVSVSAWQFGNLISGAVVVETIFARQGLGRTLLQAVLDRDVPLVCGTLIAVAVVYIVMTILTELGEYLLDPRGSRAQTSSAREVLI